MNRMPPNVAAAAAAGALAVTVTIVCAAVGYGLGSLVGWEILLGALGLLVGFILGIVVVYIRYRGS